MDSLIDKSPALRHLFITMGDPRTLIILDRHPAASRPAVPHYDPTIRPEQRLPPFPLWSCMVNGTLEFCRIAWDLGYPFKPRVSVMVANKSPQRLNSWGFQDQKLSKVANSFTKSQLVQPTQGVDRLEAALTESIASLSQKPEISTTFKRFRIVLVVLWKAPGDEEHFNFRNNPEDMPRDLTAMVCSALQPLQMGKNRLDHVDVEVIRIIPLSDLTDRELPPNIGPIQVSKDITMSVYNIPNGQDDLSITMIHLAQLYYSANLLSISNIPMKSKADTVPESSMSTQTVKLYYSANTCDLLAKKDLPTDLRIHDPQYLKDRVKRLSYSKRRKRIDPETGWCTCMHTITPFSISDAPTKVFLDMTLKGSISYLSSAEKAKDSTASINNWTHALIVHKDVIFLHCLDHKLHSTFNQIEASAQDVFEVKVEGHTPPKSRVNEAKNKEFFEQIVMPNLFEDMVAFNQAEKNHPPPRLLEIIPFQYSGRLTPKMEISKTSKTMERITRWRSCFRDCAGTDKCRVAIECRRPISELVWNISSGTPVASGFGVASGLINDLLEQLQDMILQDNISDMQSAEGLVNMMINEFVGTLEGSSKAMLTKGLGSGNAQLLAYQLLFALYLVAARFNDVSDSHQKLCTRITSMIDEKSTIKSGGKEQVKVEKMEIDGGDGGNSASVDMAWSQATRFQAMTHREKEDTLMVDFKEDIKPGEPMPFKHQNSPQSSNNNSSNQGARGGASRNPNFRSRRGVRGGRADPATGREEAEQRRFPDHTIAVRYLDSVPPTFEEKAEEELEAEKRLGSRGNLLWMYWMAEKANRKQVRELDGRLPQHGEKGELL